VNISPEAFAALGDRPFLVHGGRRYSYGELSGEMSGILAALAEQGIQPGQVVAITGDYNFTAAVLFLALAGNRNIVLPLVGSDPADLDSRLREAGAEWTLNTACELPGKLQLRRLPALPFAPHPLVQQLRGAGRAGLILFSSGSTGKPKGMLHDLDTLLDSYCRGGLRELRVLAFMGLDHIGGIDIFLRAMASGSCLVVPRERSPEAICRLIEAERVDVLPATPSFLNLMLLSETFRACDLSSLKIIGFGAERMPAAVLRRLQEVFPNVRFQQKFGTSETNAIRTLNKDSDPLWMRIDDPSVQWKIVEGELWLKTPSRILGYINHEGDQLMPDGWYRTGDLVEEDAEGFFRIVGRRESVINVGGEKVNPGEVEAVLREIPAVVDCRVFGLANPLMGQVVSAEIVAAAGVAENELVRTVRRHSRTRLAPFKVPVKIQIVSGIEITNRFKKRT
jgi:acyl-coenzyme A synthetase/AMP-(fatty) acid ligase